MKERDRSIPASLTYEKLPLGGRDGGSTPDLIEDLLKLAIRKNSRDQIRVKGRELIFVGWKRDSGEGMVGVMQYFQTEDSGVFVLAQEQLYRLDKSLTGVRWGIYK